jgi:hypothetical protein
MGTKFLKAWNPEDLIAKKGSEENQYLYGNPEICEFCEFRRPSSQAGNGPTAQG